MNVAMTSDPLNGGFVPSMSRPGGNITGVSIDAGLEVWGKRLELFREIVRTISKLAILGLCQRLAHSARRDRPIDVEVAPLARLLTPR